MLPLLWKSKSFSQTSPESLFLLFVFSLLLFLLFSHSFLLFFFSKNLFILLRILPLEDFSLSFWKSQLAPSPCNSFSTKTLLTSLKSQFFLFFMVLNILFYLYGSSLHLWLCEDPPKIPFNATYMWNEVAATFLSQNSNFGSPILHVFDHFPNDFPL